MGELNQDKSLDFILKYVASVGTIYIDPEEVNPYIPDYQEFKRVINWWH